MHENETMKLSDVLFDTLSPVRRWFANYRWKCKEVLINNMNLWILFLLTSLLPLAKWSKKKGNLHWYTSGDHKNSLSNTKLICSLWKKYKHQIHLTSHWLYYIVMKIKHDSHKKSYKMCSRCFPFRAKTCSDTMSEVVTTWWHCSGEISDMVSMMAFIILNTVFPLPTHFFPLTKFFKYSYWWKSNRLTYGLFAAHLCSVPRLTGLLPRWMLIVSRTILEA